MFAACLPPALMALDRAEHVLGLVNQSGRGPDLLTVRLHPDMFDLTGQLATVAGFALRVCLPPLGRAVPDLSGPLPDRIAAARGILRVLTPADFDGAEARIIRHRAGFADLAQPAPDYVALFALPNMWFHLSMAYATLRANGLALGKADFDGLHAYPPGFTFSG